MGTLLYLRKMHLTLYFSYHIPRICSLGLENMLVSYADDATLPKVWILMLLRDLSKISAWCDLWDLRLNPNKLKV